MRDLSRRSEYYRKLAVKYHDLAKFANPPYLGDFYRGVAVRYIFMAQELSQQTEKEHAPTAQRGDLSTGEGSREAAQDLNLLAAWAGDDPRRGQH
jgi:hypothetical protein